MQREEPVESERKANWLPTPAGAHGRRIWVALSMVTA
jgi:hypothetical protein